MSILNPTDLSTGIASGKCPCGCKGEENSSGFKGGNFQISAGGEILATLSLATVNPSFEKWMKISTYLDGVDDIYADPTNFEIDVTNISSNQKYKMIILVPTFGDAVPFADRSLEWDYVTNGSVPQTVHATVTFSGVDFVSDMTRGKKVKLSTIADNEEYTVVSASLVSGNTVVTIFEDIDFSTNSWVELSYKKEYVLLGYNQTTEVLTFTGDLTSVVSSGDLIEVDGYGDFTIDTISFTSGVTSITLTTNLPYPIFANHKVYMTVENGIASAIDQVDTTYQWKPLSGMLFLSGTSLSPLDEIVIRNTHLFDVKIDAILLN